MKRPIPKAARREPRILYPDSSSKRAGNINSRKRINAPASLHNCPNNTRRIPIAVV